MNNNSNYLDSTPSILQKWQWQWRNGNGELVCFDGHQNRVLVWWFHLENLIKVIVLCVCLNALIVFFKLLFEFFLEEEIIIFILDRLHSVVGRAGHGGGGGRQGERRAERKCASKRCK